MGCIQDYLVWEQHGEYHVFYSRQLDIRYSDSRARTITYYYYLFIDINQDAMICILLLAKNTTLLTTINIWRRYNTIFSSEVWWWPGQPELLWHVYWDRKWSPESRVRTCLCFWILLSIPQPWAGAQHGALQTEELRPDLAQQLHQLQGEWLKRKRHQESR